MNKKRGTCPVCGATGILVTSKGNLWSHEPGSRRIKGKWSRCAGAGKPPKENDE